jgi:FtsH-binding integral membrane protein
MSLSRIWRAPNLVAAINILVFGVFVALVAQTLGASDQVALVVGLVAALLATVGLAAFAFQTIKRGIRMHHPRFPR